MDQVALEVRVFYYHVMNVYLRGVGGGGGGYLIYRKCIYLQLEQLGTLALHGFEVCQWIYQWMLLALSSSCLPPIGTSWYTVQC